MAEPWRDPKTGIWKLRRRVPARYTAVAGKSVVKITTGTADRREAIRLWPGVLKQWEELEAGWERQLNTVTLDLDRARELASIWAAWAAAGGHLAADGSESDLFEPLDLPEKRTPAAMELIRRRMGQHADEALKLAGVAVADDSRPLLLETMAPVVQAAYLQADLRVIGVAGTARALHPLEYARQKLPQVVRTAPALLSSPAAVSFSSIIEGWEATTAAVPRVVGETKGMMAVLERFLGHDDAARVTTADLRRWRDASLAAGGRDGTGINNNTWNGRLSMVRQVFQQAVNDARLPSNPADKALRLKPMRQDSPLPYSDAQAALILNASRQETRASLRWAHWIMAFTGMRVGEVLQLHVADLRTEDGIHFISVNEDSPDKSVKTSNRRNIPVHDALVREGLLAYAASLPHDGPLFPDKKLDRYGKRGGRSYNVVGRWIRVRLGIKDPRIVPDHSWRHRIEDELRNQDVPEDVRDVLCGHARKTTGAKYGVRGESLRRLAAAVSKIPVPAGVKMGGASNG